MAKFLDELKYVACYPSNGMKLSEKKSSFPHERLAAMSSAFHGCGDGRAIRPMAFRSASRFLPARSWE